MSGTRAISTISRRDLSSSIFFLQGKAPKEIHAILTEKLACFLPVRTKDLSAPLYIGLYWKLSTFLSIHTGNPPYISLRIGIVPAKIWAGNLPTIIKVTVPANLVVELLNKVAYRAVYQGVDKSLCRPGRKQARKHIRDARDFNNIETRAVINFLFPARQGAEGNSHHSDRNISMFPSLSG